MASDPDEVLRCPRCGDSAGVITHLAEWSASSDEDPANTCSLNEHQYVNCDGRSFWT